MPWSKVEGFEVGSWGSLSNRTSKWSIAAAAVQESNYEIGEDRDTRAEAAVRVLRAHLAELDPADTADLAAFKRWRLPLPPIFGLLAAAFLFAATSGTVS